jgi:hypothetical protein
LVTAAPMVIASSQEHRASASRHESRRIFRGSRTLKGEGFHDCTSWVSTFLRRQGC